MGLREWGSMEDGGERRERRIKWEGGMHKSREEETGQGGRGEQGDGEREREGGGG